MSNMNRRTFLGLTGGAVAGSLVAGLWLPKAAGALQTSAGVGTRTLLVVDLQGGNDALNTLVPQSGIYHDLRPTIGLADDELMSFGGLDHGVHPGLASLQPLWDSGQMTALYGTGLQGQGRSHFVAQDAWRSAQPGEPARSGWLGRWLEASVPEDASSLRAVALGQSTLAAQGAEGRPVAIQSVDGFRLRPPNGNDAVTQAMLAMTAAPEPGLFGDAQLAIPHAVEAVNELHALVSGIELSESGESDEIDLDGDAALFHAARAIIQGDVGAQVLYLTVNGFDTHSLQPTKQDVLLRLVADGLSGLFHALDASGHADRTLAMVVSEFGRRGAENGSEGTDHGQGGLSFLLGPAVAQSTVIGAPDLSDLVDGDLRITIDARTMYDSALRWLGGSDSVIHDVLGGRWDDLALLSA